jgi:hypothetical protein
MFQYNLFGGVLRAPVEFPELPVATGAPTWTIEFGELMPPLPARPIGDDTVYGDVTVRCYRTPSGHALVYDDTGRFDVTDGGALITWYRPADESTRLLDAARADVIGRVLAVALHQQGILTLHASAVAIGDDGIALLAPKGHGKSTLATALLAAGGKLLSDDTLPVATSEPIQLRPGVAQLRLWRDSALTLAGDRAEEATTAQKLVLDRLEPARVAAEPATFSAAYVLVPARPQDDQPSVTRIPCSQIQGTLGLVEHTKLGPLLGGMDAGVVFEQAATIASRVPVYFLKVGRDLARLGEVARTIADWHSSRVA